MPVYTVEIDGKQVDIEGDRPPNEGEARAALAAHVGGGVTQSTPTQFGLNKATGIGPTPWYQSRRIPGTSIDLPFSAESAAEALPAAVAGGAALLATDNPAAAGVAGGVAGEAGRQLFRRAVGVPAATGVMQRHFGLDPDSPEAAAAGLGGEALAGVAGAGAGKAMGALASGAEQSAQKAVIRNVLGGAVGEREVANAPSLAKRALASGIVNKWTKSGRLAAAESALGKASATQDAEYAAAKATGNGVEAQPVLDAIQSKLPPSIPGGGTRTAAAPERRAATRVLNDELNAVANTGGGKTGTEIPLDTTLSEIDALDQQLEPMYRRGALDPAHGKVATQEARKAFASQLRTAFPELADARLAKSELLTIREMAQRVVDGEWKPGGSDGVAGAVGSAAMGKIGPASRGIISSMASATAPLSIPARQILAKIMAGGSRTAQLWMRAADANGTNTDDQIAEREQNRRAARALQDQAKGSPSP